MRFMQIESVLQTINRSEPAKNWFSVALVETPDVINSATSESRDGYPSKNVVITQPSYPSTRKI